MNDLQAARANADALRAELVLARAQLQELHARALGAERHRDAMTDVVIRQGEQLKTLLAERDAARQVAHAAQLDADQAQRGYDERSSAYYRLREAARAVVALWDENPYHDDGDSSVTDLVNENTHGAWLAAADALKRPGFGAELALAVSNLDTAS